MDENELELELTDLQKAMIKASKDADKASRGRGLKPTARIMEWKRLFEEALGKLSDLSTATPGPSPRELTGATSSQETTPATSSTIVQADPWHAPLTKLRSATGTGLDTTRGPHTATSGHDKLDEVLAKLEKLARAVDDLHDAIGSWGARPNDPGFAPGGKFTPGGAAPIGRTTRPSAGRNEQADFRRMRAETSRANAVNMIRRAAGGV